MALLVTLDVLISMLVFAVQQEGFLEVMITLLRQLCKLATSFIRTNLEQSKMINY